MIEKKNCVKIGKIGKIHGLKGEVQLELSGDIWEDDAEYLLVEIDGILVPFFVDDYRFKSDETAYVKFRRVDTENDAQDLCGSEVYLEKSQLGEENRENLETDRAENLDQFVGYTIVDEEGTTIGVVVDTDESTQNALFSVDTPTGGNVIIPAADDYIVEIDDEEKTIGMRLPDGLLDLD